MDWYNGSRGALEKGCPCLAIGFENGRVQLLRHQNDTS